MPVQEKNKSVLHPSFVYHEVSFHLYLFLGTPSCVDSPQDLCSTWESQDNQSQLAFVSGWEQLNWDQEI